MKTYWIEDGRSLDGAARFLEASNGRLRARQQPEHLELSDSAQGGAGDVRGVRVLARELPALARVLRRWRAVRQRWASYRVVPTAGGQAGAHLYRAAGAGSAVERVGLATNGGLLEGRLFERADELRALLPPRVLEGGARRVADVWRREPGLGPPEGAKVGERFELARGLVVRLFRHGAVLERGGRRLSLLPGEERLLEELS